MSSALTQPGDPTGKRVLARRGKLARGLQVAAGEGRLRGGEIGMRQGRSCGRRPSPAGHRRRAMSGSRSLPPARAASPRRHARLSSRGDQRLSEHDLDQRRIGRELHRVPQRRDRFRRLARFEQRLALELVKVRVLRLRLDQRVDLRQRAGADRRSDRRRWRAHSAPAGWCRSSG